jgi:hypothetical protein
MTTGGDARLLLDPATGLNRYHSAPRSSGVLAYASSTANDISAAAFGHLAGLGIDSRLSGGAYTAALDRLRGRLRAAYSLSPEVDIVFAPSGTDLEYVALACVAGRGERGTHNILLGADEVGSGCIHSAFGRYFAEETALGTVVKPGQPVPGLGETTHVEMIDIPVRDEAGRARPSSEIAERMDEAIAAAAAAGRHVLVHVVHGSKTGLILPSLGDMDRLQAAHGEAVTFVVDACQARITSAAVADYLQRGAIVFITGSKFMGGPPFSGAAFLPRHFRHESGRPADGLATILRRAEWPEGWPGAERLDSSANPGLLLRLEASVFELERFQSLSLEEVTRVILAFHQAVRDQVVDPTPARRVAPYAPGEQETAETHPIEMRTLSTLDLTALAGSAATFEDATRWYKGLLAHGVRLGQPVKAVRLPGGGWGATLRIGLSMPLVVDRSTLGSGAEESFFADMARVRTALLATAS